MFVFKHSNTKIKMKVPKFKYKFTTLVPYLELNLQFL